ncbi:GlsB/YeaQ/YmgE family stress response membrane protein [Streptomyces sp. PA03-1a]|nr:GlsB/YeaQ/YmgE family stress response membrane protein [Streptomyces sp. PA03-1a]MDX2818800.1 GlsB/YeaQ/YmgE family stress response membrane protein [Streptomyces sp. PA03-5A]
MAVVHWLSAFWLVMDWLWAVLLGLALGLMVRSVPPWKRRIPLRRPTALGTLGVLAGNTAAERFGIGDEPGIDWDRHFL